MVVSKNSFTKEFQQFVDSPKRKQKISYKSVFDRSKKKQLKGIGIKEDSRAFNDSFLSGVEVKDNFDGRDQKNHQEKGESQDNIFQ